MIAIDADPRAVDAATHLKVAEFGLLVLFFSDRKRGYDVTSEMQSKWPRTLRVPAGGTELVLNG